LACAATAALGDDFGTRHAWTVDVDVGYPSVSSDLDPWTSGGFGKLRFAEDAGFAGNHATAEYRGHIANTLWVKTVLDYADDASSGLDVTEAYLDWRPLPTSANQHHFRFGAFYPPFSLENGDTGWASPFTTSWSTINSWIGEEIRPLGVEWRLRRRLSFAGSPHEIGAFASVFYGNDPAGTLLFWRGFALHDRQTRLNDRLELPPAPVFGPGGVVVGTRPQSLEPIDEIDDQPGYYAGVEWRYARRALVQLAMYDNRADPDAFADGQWGWRTRFNHLGAQFDLPHEIGLVTQWMSGATYWLIAVTPTGLRTPATTLVDDEFDAAFVLLTKQLSAAHRISARYDRFEFARTDELTIDSGHAWTLAYAYQPTAKLAVAFEWLAIESTRDLWADFYGLPRGDRAPAAAPAQLPLALAHDPLTAVGVGHPQFLWISMWTKA
jgi:hypothetical protein